MKKIIITILIGLFSCQTPVVNKDKDKNTTITKDNSKPDFSGKDCIPYKQGNPPVEKFKHYTDPLYDYVEKSPIKKENPYLGEIKIYFNRGGGSGDKTKINIENKDKIEKEEELEKKEESNKDVREIYYNGIEINDKDRFYFYGANFKIIFNNSCEYEYFNKITTLYEKKEASLGEFDNEYFSLDVNIDKEKIEIEKIENLLKEYNKNYIYDIKEITFFSIRALKSFLLFIKLTTQDPIFYKDFELEIQQSLIWLS